MKYDITFWGHSTAQKMLFRKKSIIARVLTSENSNFYTYFILEIVCWSKLNLDMLMERQTEHKYNTRNKKHAELTVHRLKIL